MSVVVLGALVWVALLKRSLLASVSFSRRLVRPMLRLQPMAGGIAEADLSAEGISGFGQEIGTRFMDNARLITGSLPAQYGFRTAGIVDIHTKSGAFDPGGEASMYGGSYDTIMPSLELGGAKGNLNYYVDGSYNHNDIGIENPTSSKTPIHDVTDQFKAFTYLSYIMDDTSRISGMAGA